MEAERISTVCLALGFASLFIGHAYLIVRAFRTHVGWGFLCLLCAPAGILFAVKHWAHVDRAAYIYLAGWVLFFAFYELPSLWAR